MKRQLRIQFFISLILLVFTLSLFVVASWSWFTALVQDRIDAEVGFVDVDLDAYFLDDLENHVAATEVQIATGVFKTGVYSVNIVEPAQTNHFDRLRLTISINSNVDTYLRIKIYEQLTLTYTNFEGIITELSILMETPMPFHYDLTGWYDNRITDNYLYYMNKVQRVNVSTPLVLQLIIEPTTPFTDYSPGYSLQISFSVEAVQALQGPQNVFSLPTAPWGSAW